MLDLLHCYGLELLLILHIEQPHRSIRGPDGYVVFETRDTVGYAHSGLNILESRCDVVELLEDHKSPLLGQTEVIALKHIILLDYSVKFGVFLDHFFGCYFIAAFILLNNF